MTLSGWDGFPTVYGNLIVDWPFLPGSRPSGGQPLVAINNVRIDIGSFFKQVVNPVASKVMAIIGPAGTVVRSLNTPLPGIYMLYHWPHFTHHCGTSPCESMYLLSTTQ